MSDLFWLSKAQMGRVEPFFPLSHGIPRVDDRGGHQRDHLCAEERIVLVGCAQGVRAHKTTCNRFIRWSRMDVFNRTLAELPGQAGEPDTVMIDATHLKTHRTAASLLKKGLFPDVLGAPGVA